MKGLFALLVVILTVSLAYAGHGGYHQYLNVPGYGQYEFGYHRGNPHHHISRYEQAHNWRFRTKVKWGDAKSGYGEHYWDYNHVDKGHKGYGKGHGHGHGHGGHGFSGHGHGHGHGGGYGHGGHHGAFSEPAANVQQPSASAPIQSRRKYKGEQGQLQYRDNRNYY